jgi:hypothetical protein
MKFSIYYLCIVLNLLREHIIIRSIWGAMALFLFNISVDTPEPNIASEQSNLGFNDQESVLELLLEKVIGLEDAIAERDDVEGSGDSEKKKSNKIKIVLFRLVQINHSVLCQTSKNQRYPIYISPQSIGIFEKDAPPPEA